MSSTWMRCISGRQISFNECDHSRLISVLLSYFLCSHFVFFTSRVVYRLLTCLSISLQAISLNVLEESAISDDITSPVCTPVSVFSVNQHDNFCVIG